MLEKKPLSMVKLSRSQFAYRNQTKKQQTKTNYHKNTIIKLTKQYKT